MAATARFTKVVQKAGKPVLHLRFLPAEQDAVLNKALAEHRVLTIVQSAVGSHTDFGEVGLGDAPLSQVLIFPGSLKEFEGRRIVGIDFDLLDRESGMVGAARHSSVLTSGHSKAPASAKPSPAAKRSGTHVPEGPLLKVLPKPEPKEPASRKSRKSPKVAVAGKTKSSPPPERKREERQVPEAVEARHRGREKMGKRDRVQPEQAIVEKKRVETGGAPAVEPLPRVWREKLQEILTCLEQDELREAKAKLRSLLGVTPAEAPGSVKG